MECAICLLELNTSIKLSCNHEFHKSCIHDMIITNKKFCPLCRKDLIEDDIKNIMKICILCNKLIENDYNYVLLKSCNCEFHYKCYSKIITSTIINCPKCHQETPYYDIKPKDYQNFKQCFYMFVKDKEKCKNTNCKLWGNPQKFGYCRNHAEKKVQNKVFQYSLRLIFKYGLQWSSLKKIQCFYKILKYYDIFGINRKDDKKIMKYVQENIIEIKNS